MYRRNSDALNRSQQMCSEMAVFNEEQLEMLKKHNDFLTNENAKLSKACEKYMNEARECTKLRMEMMKLREKINNQKLLWLKRIKSKDKEMGLRINKCIQKLLVHWPITFSRLHNNTFNQNPLTQNNIK